MATNKRVKRRIVPTSKANTDKPKPPSKLKKLHTRTPTTEVGRENQLTSLAMDLAERQIRDGTASAQVITHFLKVGSQAQRLEVEKLRRETVLLEAKTKDLESRKETKEMFEAALKAMNMYRGQGSDDDEEDDDV